MLFLSQFAREDTGERTTNARAARPPLACPGSSRATCVLCVEERHIKVPAPSPPCFLSAYKSAQQLLPGLGSRLNERAAGTLVITSVSSFDTSRRLGRGSSANDSGRLKSRAGSAASRDTAAGTTTCNQLAAAAPHVQQSQQLGGPRRQPRGLGGAHKHGTRTHGGTLRDET